MCQIYYWFNPIIVSPTTVIASSIWCLYAMMFYYYFIATFTYNCHGAIGSWWAGLHNIYAHISWGIMLCHSEHLLDKLVFPLAHEYPHLFGDVLHVCSAFVCHVADRFMGLVIYVNARHDT